MKTREQLNLENYQQADGSVVVPEVLRPYTVSYTHLTLPTNSRV